MVEIQKFLYSDKILQKLYSQGNSTLRHTRPQGFYSWYLLCFKITPGRL